MDSYKKLNLVLGWLCFLISFFVYFTTAEPTVSFWDTGEYITTSSKLQVGHPPGAPLYQMLGAFFSVFALENENIGFIMNLMSGFVSALAISFLYWSIVLVLKKIVSIKIDSQKIKFSISSAAFIGSLSFAFTDTFWFNAVEAEVYAMATLIMAILFYLGLRWEADMQNQRGNMWLLLISFVIGLSFGVHFMGLLTIPGLVLIYYYKNRHQLLKIFKVNNFYGFIIANLIGVIILMGIFKLLLPNTLRFFSSIELFFVNSLGLPFNSGTAVALLLIVLFFIIALSYTHKHDHVKSNTFTLCFMFMFIGFSSWLILPIRANANVVVNENNPSNARELLAYYNLEQYPKTYLFYGPLFTDQYSGLDENKPYKDDNPKYEKDLKNNRYKVVNDYKNAIQNYNSDHAAFLPRMWSSEHAVNYYSYTGFLDFNVKPKYINESELNNLVRGFKNEINNGDVSYEDFHNFLRQYGQFLSIEKPSFLSNLYYLFEYQLGYMYFRYFMWNFSGRQDDIQGKKNLNGNWITGISFIDKLHLGITQENLPGDISDNKARNTYFLLPLIFGIIGFIFLKQKSTDYFWILLIFFVFTGMAIQVYTNVRPFEPRERDYSVVGSFYVFSIMIGIGVYYLSTIMHKLKSNFGLIIILFFCFLFLPVNLISNNWDDHDRSGRYSVHSMAVNYLESCDKDAILFTIGDNDTFPLWYAQEIEGIRTDIRVVNTSLLSTDWYIDQMKRKAYESNPIPSSLEHEKYKHGTRDYIIKDVVTDSLWDIKGVIDFVTNDDNRYGLLLDLQGYDTSLYRSQDLNSNFLPTENIKIPVNKENVLKYGIVDEKYEDKILDEIILKINSQAIYKNRLIMLDIIAENEWKRPVYFSGGAFGDEDYIWMKEYLQLDGMCYKLVPIKTPINENEPYKMGMIDSEKMVEIVKNWKWGKREKKDVYLDVESRKNSITYRGNISRLIQKLIEKNDFNSAEIILDITMKNMPIDEYGYYTLLEEFILSYYVIGKVKKGKEIYSEISKKYKESLDYFSQVSDLNKIRYIEEIYIDIERYRSLINTIIDYEQEEFLEKELETLNSYIEFLL